LHGLASIRVKPTNPQSYPQVRLFCFADAAWSVLHPPGAGSEPRRWESHAGATSSAAGVYASNFGFLGPCMVRSPSATTWVCRRFGR
jgi:hypothetical protein